MIELDHLGVAYRKAKVDLYYSSLTSLDAIADYEENLYFNLSELQEKLSRVDESWATQSDFIGTWTLAAKTINMDKDSWRSYRQNKGLLIYSSPSEDWETVCKAMAEDASLKKPKAEFRVMAKCSLNFHVLSTLWILEVGHLFDVKLSGCASGNRLRRIQNGKKINKLSLGSFQPYLKPFRDWRDNGINAMRTALDANKKIIALTGDISSFYHELNPSFMLDSKFLNEVLKLKLNDDQQKLHRIFISALQTWAINSPLKKGLPVGLPASAIVANMALIELDRMIEEQITPIYYGRYVDDILLIMENGTGFSSTTEVWEWLFARSKGLLNWTDVDEKTRIRFQPSYLNQTSNKSQIHFDNEKNKVFILNGETGKTLVDAIAHQIQERASKWRAMPRLPYSPEHVGPALLAATQNDGENADNLRKTDTLTMRRASFAIKLRDFEAYERDLLPESWAKHRQAFFRAYIEHVLVLPQFFDLAIYLPRIIRMATACEDFIALRQIIDTLESLYLQVEKCCKITIKALPEELDEVYKNEVLNRWKRQLFLNVRESIRAAFPPRISKTGRQTWQKYMSNCNLMIDLETYLPILTDKQEWQESIQEYDLFFDFEINSITSPCSDKVLKIQHARLFSFDLAHMPFRFVGLPKEMVAQRGIPTKKTVVVISEAEKLVSGSIIKGIKILAEWLGLKEIPHGLLFPTRPFNLPELFVLNKHAYALLEHKRMRAVVLAVRGFSLNEKTPTFDRNGVLQIPDGEPVTKYGIGVSSWQTNMESWTASVMRLPDPDVHRYARLCCLLDGVISQPRHSRYLILPELALPAHWFIRIARKLQGRGISLITGIEYLHASKSRVRNQVWVALSHDGLGFPSLMIYRQDKQHPALREEQELQRLGGLKIKPHKHWNTPPIIQHGNFRFALLICSELTNISYRSALRGKVDALFVPEWNQDTETFNTLVESAALDIHAYIIQCNDRQYGDSRIRAPFKDMWKRDVLRVKGGVTDYCVIGEIDINALRQFQSSHRSPNTPFKPVPDGFKIDHERKVLPLGDTP